VPKPKKPSPPPSKGPRTVFIVTILLIGVAVVIGIWLSEQRSHPQPKAKPAAPAQKTEKKIVQPVQVLNMSKTNLPSQPTNVSPLVLTKVAPAPAAPPPPTNSPPVARFPQRFAQTVLEAQVAMARLGISSGSIDGVSGSQTRSALRAFQRGENIPVTGELDAVTKSRLILEPPLYSDFIVTADDLARLRPLGTGWLSKSQQGPLEHETMLELIAERSHCHPGFIKQLNPGISWTNLAPGAVVRIPNIEITRPSATASLIQIRLAEKVLEAFDANMNLLAHFPCSIAQRIEKRPVGELRVAVIAENPDYTFNPEIFPESAEARQIGMKLMLAPGPNNPVGTVWIGLDKPGYGIHGSPKPEDVGRTESHGCFRLANWNAEYLLRLVTVGTLVRVEP